MTRPILTVQNLGKTYPVKKGLFSKGTLVAAEDVSFTIHAGETVALVGESGSGKSTVGRCVLRLEEPDSGSIEFEDTDLLNVSETALPALRARMQMVFQDPLASLTPRHKVGKLVGEPLLLHATVPPREIDAKVAELFELVGLRRDHAERYAHQISGGQQQRVGIARALATNPALVVLDEPTSALDVSVEAQILNLLMDLQEQFNLAYLFISHDLAVVRLIAKRVMVMYLGQVVEAGPTEDVLTRSFHPYTRGLVSATPIEHPLEVKQRINLTGEPSSPIDPKPQCRLVSRCPFARPECSQEPTELKEVKPGHFTRCIRFQREHVDGVWNPEPVTV
ncbi:oligopeptide/dipeptide ABC transporter ATP-binding protein [Martelella sp. HB161492]|uniref:ABC transporter ATP-binding protein n=1 Tax=Martelella sp. HB161492 TaxID=2720726 RepID=UPI00158FBE3A|nr:oligopeptide/dipeptide ABC transporter ATP-binding protein [Martelella sp. HB161492]